jgi:2-hydroxychromene-2-carboxylate isomerase
VALNAFWQDFWVQWKDPLKPDAIFKILSEVLGGGSKGEEEAKKVVETMQSEEVKKVLGANTERAFQEGAFGLPWFTATNAKGETEGFWGVDHLGQMCDFLGLERPRDGKGWRAML